MHNLTTLAGQLKSDKWLITSTGYQSLLSNINIKLAQPNINMKQASLNQVTQADFTIDTSATSGPSIALISINGILVKGASEEQEEELGVCNIDCISEALDNCIADPAVSEICLCFNSPGGSITGLEELGRKIANSTKLVSGWTETRACSAAYWLYSQCNKTGCTPSAELGSIGVMLLLDDVSEAMEKAGIKKEAFHSGKYKLLGQDFKSLTSEERDILQTGVNETHEQFKQAILSKRQIDPSYMEGLVYEGNKALAGNLVDIVTDSLGQFLTSDNYKLINDMNKVTKIAKPDATLTAPVLDKQATAPETKPEEKAKVPGVPGTKEADTANGVPPNPVHYTTPNHKAEAKEEGKEAESGHYGGGYIACPACKLNFKLEASHMVAGPETVPDKPEDKPTSADKSEIKEDEQNDQKTEKPNEKAEDKENKKEATAQSFTEWRNQTLGITKKAISPFHKAVSEAFIKSTK
jgi:protease-4